MYHFKAFQDHFDIILYNQVFRFCMSHVKKTSDTDFALDKNLFFDSGETFETIGVQYGFQYPGELLERYAEVIGPDIKYVRAMALATVQLKKHLSDEMFVGTQFQDFINNITKIRVGDLYLLAVMFLLSDNYDEKEKIKEEILSLNPKTEEAIFLLWIFSSVNSETAWSTLKNVLEKLLGVNRSISISDNISIYRWFLANYDTTIKSYRKRDIPTLKALAATRSGILKKGSSAYCNLINSGYCHNEILYLNNILLADAVGFDSITAERLAYSTCLEVLNSEFCQDDYLCDMVERLLYQYNLYSIKLEGYDSLSKHLDGQNKILIKNPKLFNYLHKISSLNRAWFRIDFTDSVWDDILKKMDEKTYLEIFNSSILYFCDSNLSIWLEKFKQMAGKEYRETFFIKKYEWDNFSFMIEEKQFTTSFLTAKLIASEEDESLSVFADYIHQLLKDFGTVEAFDILKQYHDSQGDCKFYKLCHDNDIFRRGLNLDFTYYWSNSEPNLLKNFLSPYDQLTVLSWGAEYMYRYHGDRYKYYISCLLDKDYLLPYYSKSEIAGFLSYISPLLNWEPENLYERYYSPEDFSSYQHKKNTEKQAQEEHEKQCQIREIREVVTKHTSNGDFKSLESYISNYYWSNTKYQDAVFTAVVNALELCNSSIKRVEASQLGKTLFQLWEYTDIPFDLLKYAVSLLERSLYAKSMHETC